MISALQHLVNLKLKISKKRVKDYFLYEARGYWYQYFGTIHHVCVQLLGWDLKNNNPKLVSDADRAAYLHIHGLDYPVNKNINDLPETIINDTDVDELSDEEKLFAVIQRCNSLCLPLNKWRHTDVEFSSLDPDFVYPICQGWNAYKNEYGLVDFDDMLLDVLNGENTPPCKILFVDEFQDLTPLLYKIVMMWAKTMDQVYVSGDDDQTIYTWSGANPNFLLDLPGKEEILSISYRVPSNILQKANFLINLIGNRRQKPFSSVRSGGKFIHLNSPLDTELLDLIPFDKSIFFLFRTNYLARLFINGFLLNYGIPFSNIKVKQNLPGVWTPRLLELCSGMLKLESGNPLTLTEVRRLVELLPSCSKGSADSFVYYGVKSKIKKKGQRALWTKQDIVDDVLARIPRWDSTVIAKGLNDSQRKALNHYMLGDFKNINPFNIKIGTLHSCKGLEADVVFVFNNHTKRTEEALLENPKTWDQEARLYYVGLTRAKETCVLVDDYFRKFIFDMRCSI